VSNGFSHGVSITVTGVDCAAGRSATSGTWCVIAPQVTTVAAGPVRRTRLPPMGDGGRPVTIACFSPKYSVRLSMTTTGSSQ
jgi:hypothetical protein